MDLVGPSEVRSKESLRFAFVLEQGFDRSCGYSVAASLLSLYWGLEASEEGLIEGYAGQSPPEGGLQANFALLARIFSDYGFSTKGTRMGWDQLSAALARYAPIVVHYERPDRHFALALRSDENWIIVLDPASGCELLNRGQFMERWSGAALLAWSSDAVPDEARVSDAIRVEEARRELLGRQPR